MEYERFVKARAVECFEIRVFLWSHERERGKSSKPKRKNQKENTNKKKQKLHENIRENEDEANEDKRLI